MLKERNSYHNHPTLLDKQTKVKIAEPDKKSLLVANPTSAL